MDEISIATSPRGSKRRLGAIGARRFRRAPAGVFARSLWRSTARWNRPKGGGRGFSEPRNGGLEGQVFSRRVRVRDPPPWRALRK